MILGVDPGLATLGWCVVDHRGAVHDLGFVETEHDANAGVQRDRVDRTGHIARELLAVVTRWDVGAIAAEALSFPPMGRVAAVASLCLAWGAVAALGAVWDVPVHDVPPKVWQQAIVQRKGKVEYSDVEAALHSYVQAQNEHVESQLLAIPKGKRNHALDAVGIGVYAALKLLDK